MVRLMPDVRAAGSSPELPVSSFRQLQFLADGLLNVAPRSAIEARVLLSRTPLPYLSIDTNVTGVRQVRRGSPACRVTTPGRIAA